MPIHLGGVAGKIEQCDVGLGSLAVEVLERLCHVLARCIEPQADLEADLLQGGADAAGVVGRILECLEIAVMTVADHERDAPLGAHALELGVGQLGAAGLRQKCDREQHERQMTAV